MGLGTGTLSQVTGQDITTNAVIPAYSSVPSTIFGLSPTQVDTIPSGSDLGVCIDYSDCTVLGAGSVYLKFSGPVQGSAGQITGPFWVLMNGSINYTPPTDAGVSLPSWVMWAGIGAFIIIMFLIFLKYSKK